MTTKFNNDGDRMSRPGMLLLLLLVSVLITSVTAADPAVPATTVPPPDSGLSESAPLDPAPRSTVTTLPVIITVPGTYVFDRDYLDVAGATAIDVRCPDVVIDGGGHTLDGLDFADSTGILVHGSAALSGVTIRNLRVTDWGQGVHFWNARGRIESVTASSNIGSGILLYSGGDATVVTGCTVESNGAGGLSASFAPGIEIRPAPCGTTPTTVSISTNRAAPGLPARPPAGTRSQASLFSGPVPAGSPVSSSPGAG